MQGERLLLAVSPDRATASDRLAEVNVDGGTGCGDDPLQLTRGRDVESLKSQVVSEIEECK